VDVIYLAQGKGKVADACEQGNESCRPHKTRGISRLAERPLTSHEEFSSMELVSYSSFFCIYSDTPLQTIDNL
jgi:hypothetical protein